MATNDNMKRKFHGSTWTFCKDECHAQRQLAHIPHARLGGTEGLFGILQGDLLLYNFANKPIIDSCEFIFAAGSHNN